MRMDLDVQVIIHFKSYVLSETVSNVLRTFGSPEAEETAEFAKMFDRWFEYLQL